MELYILGKNNDDKGTQLEKLTVQLLKNQGYTNITCNEISNGGNEIDVIATHKYLLGAQYIECPVICECKAHNKPITMNDWLKFIGKFFLKKLENPQTISLFIALSGANGNVIGSYNALKRNTSIHLLTNDDLTNLIKQYYNLNDISYIKKQIQDFYPIDISNTNLIYYNQQIWWIIEFVNGKYTIWEQQNINIENDSLELLIQMINDYTPYTKTNYINIREEAHTILLIQKINIYLISILSDEKEHSIKDIAPNIRLYKEENTINEEFIINIIKENPFIEFYRETNTIKLIDEKNINFIIFYQYIFSLNIPPIELIQTNFYQRNINHSLLKEIYKIQFDFHLSPNLEKKCLFLLQHSPTALKYALKADPFFTNSKQCNSNTKMKKLFENYFIDQLTQSFIHDFRSKEYGWLYHKYFKLHTIETETTLKIKGENIIKEFHTIREGELYHKKDIGIMFIEKIVNK